MNRNHYFSSDVHNTTPSASVDIREPNFLLIQANLLESRFLRCKPHLTSPGHLGDEGLLNTISELVFENVLKANYDFKKPYFIPVTSHNADYSFH